MTAPRNWRGASEILQGRKPRLGDRFLAAGFSKDHLLEVIAAVAASTITNYTGSITKTGGVTTGSAGRKPDRS